MMMGQLGHNPSLTLSQSSKAEDNDEHKHQGLIISKNSTHDDDGNDRAPSQAVDHRSWVNALNDDANTHINPTGPCLVATTQHPQHLYTKPLSYNAEKLLNVMAIWRVASGYVYGVGASVMRFPWHILHCSTLLKTPGVVIS